MSRLTIDLTDEQHKRLKATAAIEGKSIKEFAVERLFNGEVWTTDELDAWGELKTLLEHRIAQVEAGHISPRSILDIANDGLRRHKAA